MNLFRRKVVPAIKSASGTKLNEIRAAPVASLKMPDNIT